MKLRNILLLYIFLPAAIALVFAEFWVRKNDLVGLGTDRVLHPYIGVGGFHRGGYFGNTVPIHERGEVYGYFEKTWMKVPSFEYGTPVQSVAERGRFLYRDRAKLLVMPKPKDEFRIFILGGSTAFAEGASVPEHRWYVHLENILRERTHKNVVVIPAANHSHVTTQERVILDLYVAPFSPDMLIFLDGFNDANTGTFAVRPGDPGEQSIQYTVEKSPLFGFLRDISKHSALVRFAMQKSVSAVWFSGHTPEQDQQQARSVANVYFDNLTQLNRRCKIEKFKCLFFLQPYWEMTASNRKEKPFLPGDMINMNYTEIKNRLKAYPFVIDYTGVFDSEPAKIPFYDSAHFRDEGHRILAEQMANLIIAKKMIN